MGHDKGSRVMVVADKTPTDEVMDFLLSRPTPEEIISLRPSQAAQERLRYLLEGNAHHTLSDSERAELDSYLQVEHFVRQLKIRARERLAGEA
jgi:hypothetical protein